jgi:hypothetical protein
LKHLSSIFDQISWSLHWCFTLHCTQIIHALLGKLVWAWWELDIRILIDELLMKITEGLVLLIYNPSLVIKVYLDNVFSILTVILRINIDSSLADADTQRYLEEMWSSVPVVFVASFDMFNEDLRWEEHLTELTLHWLRMLEYSLVDLNLTYLLA